MRNKMFKDKKYLICVPKLFGKIVRFKLCCGGYRSRAKERGEITYRLRYKREDTVPVAARHKERSNPSWRQAIEKEKCMSIHVT